MSDAALRFDVISLFPEIIDAGMDVGVVGRAVRRGLLEVHTHQLRDYTGGSPHPVDDAPYGGGAGMVMRPEPIFHVVEQVSAISRPDRRIVMTPQGAPFGQTTAERLSTYGSLLLFCGRYEGIDERARTLFDEEVSIGDYVLSGGEIPALAVMDATARLVAGVLGSDTSVVDESFSADLLEYPQYTRPAEFRGMRVPSVLTSGNHAAIKQWRDEQARKRTRERRPDLLAVDPGGDCDE